MQGTAAAGAGGWYPLQHLSRERETSPDPPDSDTVTTRGVNKHSRSFHNARMRRPRHPTREQLLTAFKCPLSLSECLNKFLSVKALEGTFNKEKAQASSKGLLRAL